MAITAVSPQKIPDLKVPFRSRFNLTFPNNFTTYPDIVKPICKSIKFEVGDTIDISVDLSLMYLYLKSPIIDALQADLYAFFTRYSQVSNKYKRVRGERLSVSSDEREYVMPRITSTYPIVWGLFTNQGEVGSGRLYADALEWQQDGEDIRPQIFDITTGKNVDPVINVVGQSSVPASLRVVNGYHLPYDDISLKPIGFNDCCIFGFMLGSLPEALGYGCGTPFMAYTAVDILAYYLSCDYYFRNAEIFDSIVGLVPDVDVDRPWNIWSDWQGMVPYYDYAYGSIKQFLYPESATTDQEFVDDYKSLSSYTAFNRLTGLAPGGFYRASRKPDYQALGLASPTYGGIDVLMPGLSGEGVAPVVGNGKALGMQFGEKEAGAYLALIQGDTVNTVMRVKENALNVDTGQTTSSGTAINDSGVIGVSTNPKNSGLQVEFNAGTMLELRSNFQLLRFLEAKNRSGKYFTDLMNNLFGIADKRPDERFPELLGVLTGSFNFIPNIQTSAASDTPQGNITTNAMCRIKGKICHKTSLEDGIVQLLLVIRQPSITLPNRIDKRLFEFRELDFMQPLFARLGDQPILNYEINMPLISGFDLFKKTNLTQRTTSGIITPQTRKHPFHYYYEEVQNKIFDVNSYQERYGELKYSFSQVSDLFNPRSAKVPCYIQPLYQKYVWRDDLDDFVISNYDGPQLQGGICRLVPSLAPWNYTLGFDANIAESNVGYLSNLSKNKSSLSNLASDFPDRRDPRLSKSITPFGKNSASLELPPFEGQVVVYVTADRILPVNSAPGLADHF